MADHRLDLLRTQAVHACLTAMGAAEGNIYGSAPDQWSGTVLESADTLRSTSHWRDQDGDWRYEVTVTVEVKRTLL